MEEFLRRLILVNQLDDIAAMLADPPFPGEAILAAVDAGVRDGQPGQAALLRFLRPYIVAALPEWARTAPGDLVTRAASLPDGLSVFLLARREPALLSADAFGEVMAIFGDPRAPQPVRHRFAMVAGVLGTLRPERSARLQGRLCWCTVLRYRGNFERAVFHAQRAERLAESEEERSWVLGTLSALHETSGNPQGSVEVLERALAGSLPLRIQVSMRWSLARNLHRLGRFADALAEVNTTLADVAPGEPAITRYELVTLRARLHEALGRPDLAAGDHREAIEYATAVPDRDREFEARTAQATALWQAQRRPEARRLLRQILDLVRHWDRPDLVGAALNNLGQLELAMGLVEPAREHFGESMTMRPVEDHSRGAVIALYGLADAMGEGHGDAMAPLHQMALVTGMVGGLAAEAAAMYAQRAHGTEENETVERLLREMREKGNQQDDWPTVLQASLALAAYLSAHGREPEAIVLRREFCDAARQRGGGGDFMVAARAHAQGLLTMPGGRQEAFDVLWEARAVLLGLQSAADDPRRHGELVSEFIGVYEGLLDALFASGPLTLPPGPASAEELAFALHEEARSRTSLAEAVPGGRPVGLSETRAIITAHGPAAGMAVVSYFCGRDTTTCFVVDADSPGLRAYRIPLGSARLTEAARLLRQAFDGDPAAFPPRPPIHPRRPHRRDLTFLDELGAELLPFASRPFPLLCVVPHGPLHLLPLHALPDATGTPLAARCAVTYAPSLSLLAYGMEQAPRAGRRILVAAVAGREDPEPAAFERDGDYLRAAGAHISELTGTAATRPALLAALAGHDVAHVTCHGYTDPHNPMESGLVVADEDGRPTKFVDRLSIRKRRRSVLRAEDIADARVALRLVTLRACASGQVAAQHAGDEFTGLARSLLRAGAASTVTALWNVDQESSGRLHELMYRHWLGGEPLWRALWLAQRSLMDDATRPAWNHRYHWAPLVLIGDWR